MNVRPPVYVYLKRPRAGFAVVTREIGDGGIYIDYGKDGLPIGVEVLGAVRVEVGGKIVAAVRRRKK